MNIRPAALLLFLLTLTLAGCKEEPPVEVNRARSYLHIISGADVDPFDVTFNYYNADNIVIDDFFFRRNFPNVGYANLEATDDLDEFGNGEMSLTLSRQIFANEDPDSLLPTEVLVLNPDEQATLCFADSMGTMVTLKIADNYTFADGDNQAKVRFINLASAIDDANLTTATTALNLNGVGFLQFTDFESIDPLYQDFEIRDAGGTLLDGQQVYLYPRTAYTVILGGNGNGTLGWFQH